MFNLLANLVDMARNITLVIKALRDTAHALEQSSEYQWGHMGCCNCGFLAQQITRLKKSQIHSYAMQGYGDWNEQLNDYCPTSGLPMDDLISEMIQFGFDTDDLKNLERLADKKILDSLLVNERNLYFNVKSDVIKYLNAWASLLEEDCISQVALTDLYTNPVAV
jgi:hypothetical protein